MIMELRCLYIERSNPIVTDEVMEEVFGIEDYDDKGKGYIYPNDAFSVLHEHGWICVNGPDLESMEELAKPISKFAYAFIKKR